MSKIEADDVGKVVARALFSAGCITVQTNEPFRLPSGWASPVYMDCRRLISFPVIRRQIVSYGLDLLRAQGCLNGITSVVGCESSGIALAAWFAEALGLPLQYVRKKLAGNSQIEGVLAPGGSVLLIDDLMSAGHSKLKFCRALLAAGAVVQHVFVVFDYATFHAGELLQSLGVEVHFLANWEDVLAVAQEDGAFDNQAIAQIKSFIADPQSWSLAHGGIATAIPANQPTRSDR